MICPGHLHPGSRWMPNVFISSEIGSQWRTILGHPQLIECMGIRVLSLAHGSELRGSDVYLHIPIFSNCFKSINPPELFGLETKNS